MLREPKYLYCPQMYTVEPMIFNTFNLVIFHSLFLYIVDNSILKSTECLPLMLNSIDPFTVYVTGKFEVRMSGSERSFHPIVLTREFLVKTKLRAVTVADFYHRGGNGPTTTGGAVL